MNHSTSVPLSFFFDRRIPVKAIFIVTGFMPVTCIALNVFQVIPLYISAYVLAFPCFVFIFFLGLKYTEEGNTALQGWLAGLIAVALYDCARVPFILAGWEDFVPRIGDWIFNEKGNNGLIGYLWRYIGNGGGMGIAFMLLVKKERSRSVYIWKGILYGLFIFSCLMMVLLLSPDGEVMMFKITPLNFTGSILGHVIYGWVLGYHLFRKRMFIKKTFSAVH